MNGEQQISWLSSNQIALTAHLDRLRGLLEAHVSNTVAAQVVVPEAGDAISDLCILFDLSDFERDVLLLCAGAELDSRISQLCGQLDEYGRNGTVTFELACAVLPDAHWSAILPTSALREWHLIDVDSMHGSRTLVQSQIRIQERVLHYLTGLNYLDERLAALMRQCEVPDGLLPSHEDSANRIASILADPEPSIVMLTGGDVRLRRAVGAAAAAHLHARLFSMSSSDSPVDPSERDGLARLWEREAKLSPVMLMIDCDASLPQSTGFALADAIRTDAIVSCREPLAQRTSSHKKVIWIELAKPTSRERREWWIRGSERTAAALNGHLDAIASQFDLSPGEIDAAKASAKGTDPDDLWDACRAQARTTIDDLAQRIDAISTWDDLVLPRAQFVTLRQIGAHMRQRLKVYEEWGFASLSSRGLGISTLFAGSSGTGKTMAAEVLANELRLDLYRIDLSQIVSKYVGETEKNLKRVFDAAEHGGVILLFDEADALFGKRSEVKDSHDRYANIEISYLLQQMEAYRGLAILTTNQRSALDTAFLRRLRFIVEFPFPDAAMRADIWRRIFPKATPRTDLDFSKLSRLGVPGGNIRNMALNAAFLAADDGDAVSMSHILKAARTEYAKLEKPLTEAETSDWIAQ